MTVSGGANFRWSSIAGAGNGLSTAGTGVILDNLNGGIAGHYHLDRLVFVVHRLVRGPLGHVDEIACLELQGSGQPVAY